MVVSPRLRRTRVLSPAPSTDFSGRQRLERPDMETLSALRIRQDGKLIFVRSGARGGGASAAGSPRAAPGAGRAGASCGRAD